MPDASGHPAAPPLPVATDLSLWDRVLGWRDRMLQTPGFHRFASRFPLTRPFVRSEAGALFDLCAGFVYAQVLDACVRLELFFLLKDGPIPTADLAAACGMPEAEMTRLLKAAVALRLVAPRSKGRWGLGQLGAAVLGTPGLAEMIRHHRTLYDDMRDPVALLRAQGADAAMNRYWTYARKGDVSGLSADQVAEYSELMAATQRMLSDDILDVARLDRFEHVMDVGGGNGTFLMRAAARAPATAFTLYDLPNVAEIAHGRIAEAGLSDRIRTVGGDFRQDALPDGLSAISLVRVLYDHPDAVAVALLRKVRDALPKGGTVIIAEPMDGAGGEARVGAAYFGFYLLAMGGGSARNPERFSEMLAEAGFADMRVLKTAKPMLVRVITAKVAD